MLKSKSNRVPAWDLSSIYNSIKDPNILRSINLTTRKAKTFQRKYKGKIAAKLKNSQSLAACLAEYESINQEISKPLSFAQLVFSADQSKSEHGIFLQKMKIAWTEVQKILVFFELELCALPERRIKVWIKTRTLARYANFLQILLANKKHMLTEASEKIIADLDLSGRSAFVRLYSEEQSARRYHLQLKPKSIVLTEDKVFDYLQSSKRAEREVAFHSISSELKNQSRRLAYIFNTLLADKNIKDRYRTYKLPEDSRHQANQVSHATINGMVNVVTKNYKLAQNFYEFKAECLNLKKLEYWDRVAPVGKLKLKFTFSEARTIVLDAFQRFSSDYAGIAEEFFERNWIDAAPRPGKRAGAYCSFMTPDLHPYVFMNFGCTLRDVYTLAHELGHAIHARLMSGTSYLNYNVPLTIAEVASTFAELLVFEHMLELLPKREQKFALQINKLDNLIATIFRQVSMFRFEQSFHNTARQKGELSVAEINALWVKTQNEFYKNSIRHHPGYEYWWSYIPHFIHTPFYVYAYAFGDLMALSLYNKYKTQSQGFVSSYMKMLSLGNSASPQQLATNMGISLNSTKFWQGGMGIFKELLKDTIAFG